MKDEFSGPGPRAVATRNRCRHPAHIGVIGLLALSLGMLAGCSLMPFGDRTPEVQPQPWESRRETLLALPGWSLRGRIAVQHASEGWNAGISWRQHGEVFDLRILAPLGRGTYRLSGDGETVVLTDPQGTAYRAADVEALMQQHLSWHLPVAGARYWVLGVPAVGAPVEHLNVGPDGMLADVAQDGWRISFSDYAKDKDVVLPHKLFMIRDDVRVRMVISQWKIGSP